MATKPKTTATRSTRAKTTQAPNNLTRSATATRLPLTNRSNSPERVPSRSTQPKALSQKGSYTSVLFEDEDREPIKAFLRIRPQTGDESTFDASSTPYLVPISDSAVRMMDPSSSSSPHSRMSTLSPSSIYTFSHVFPPSTQQSEFFTKTTLPLVKDALEGRNGLLFTYGVTNSGKTYTIQGATGRGSAGILPRTLDVIFNSIESLHGDGRYMPVRLQGIELASENPPSSSRAVHTPKSKQSLASLLDASDAPLSDLDTDLTTLKLDRNYEYTIWLSYSEVYNEKVYDLFESVDDPSTSLSPSPSPTHTSRPTSTFLNLPLPSTGTHSKPLLLSRKALQVRPCPPSDFDPDSGDRDRDREAQGKYVAGLRQLRVTSAAQAKALLRLGQMHRRVFGTLANSQSSRSHAVVTIKVLRLHRGERDNPQSIQTSRLTLVDLAGSERTKHTQTSGERLKEAGSINKSLMVLGQCMETMRSNQRILARALSAHSSPEARIDTRDVKKGLAVVPFRHSKLTEILMDYFAGEGHAVMIVNVNPYDTGYDENSHVMKFSALAREVCTTAPTAVSRAIPVGARSSDQSTTSHRRKVTISMGGPGHQTNETYLEVLEEDEEAGGEDDRDSDEPINPLVDALFDEIERLRMQLFESEMRCAIIEADTREEVMQEMEERMRTMEKTYTRRLMKEIEQNEVKMDAKIDMIQRAQRGTGSTSQETLSEDLEDINEESEEDVQHELGAGNADHTRTHSLSSFATKGPCKFVRTNEPLLRPSDDDRTDDDEYELPTQLSTQDTSQSSQSSVYHSPHGRPAGHHILVPPTPVFEVDVKAKKLTNSKSKSGTSLTSLLEQARALSLDDDDDDLGASAAIIPDRNARADESSGKGDTAGKKKRFIGKKPTVTATRDTPAADSEASRQSLRRSTRSQAVFKHKPC